MTQRVRRAERTRRQRTEDRGLVYRGAHVYAWADRTALVVAEALAADRKPATSIADMLGREFRGAMLSQARFLAFELGAHDLPCLAPLFGPAWSR